MVLDIDGDVGMENLTRLGTIPSTPTVKTSRGHHYYFKRPEFRIVNKSALLPGIDIRGDGGMIVAPPSIHESGHQYEWVISLNDVPLADMPEWLLKLTTWKEPVHHTTFENTRSVDRKSELARVVQALSCISAEERNEWLTVGMALHDFTGGDGEGYRIWTDWSRTSKKFNEKDQIRQYNSFQAGRAGGITLASLFGLARNGGWIETEVSPVIVPHLVETNNRPETRTHNRPTHWGCCQSDHASPEKEVHRVRPSSIPHALGGARTDRPYNSGYGNRGPVFGP